MKIDDQIIKDFFEALLKLDKKEVNDVQKEFLDYASKHGIKNESLLLLLKNKAIYNGLDEFSKLRSLLLDQKDIKPDKNIDVNPKSTSKPGISIKPEKEGGGLGSDPNTRQDIRLDWD